MPDLHPIGRHRANRLPDSDSRAMCTDAGIHPGCIYECPMHNPGDYSLFEAKHKAPSTLRCMHPLHLAAAHTISDSCVMMPVGAR